MSRWMLAECDEAVARREDTPGYGRLAANVDLTLAGRSANLLDTIGEDTGANPADSEVPAAGHQWVGTLHADVARVKLVGFSALDAVPLERFQPVFDHEAKSIVRVEDIHVGRTEAASFIDHA